MDDQGVVLEYISIFFSFFFYPWNIFYSYISYTLCHKSVSSGGCVRLSDKTLYFIYFAFCDSQSHAVTVTPTVLYSPIIYLSPSIIILALAYVWCTFDILVLGFVTPCVF